MLHRYSLLVGFLLTGALLTARAQTSPIITRADMPVPTDTLRQSTATVLLPASAPPLSRRGPNQTWNYAALVATAQNVARFTAVPNQPLYLLTFSSPLSLPNRATVAAPQRLPLPPGFTLPITDPYQFFNASSADFRSVGYGGTLAGTAVPVTYSGPARQDVIYRFPLSFASSADSSSSFFATPAAAASVGYFSQERKRVNRVDAWGTLTTPYGTFQTIRVVSRIEDQDSISAGGINQGFTLPVTREYKWLATGQHVPLLTITTTQVGAQEVVSGVEYRDIYRRLGPLSTSHTHAERPIRLFPNPSASTQTLHLTLPAAGPATITATDLAGRLLFRHMLPYAARETELPAHLFGPFRGVLLLRVQTEGSVSVRRIVRE